MRIGLDFDNTIVSYDALFHRVALEQRVIPTDTPVSKLAVRNHLRSIGSEPVWTEMQGTVYGARMCEAKPYPGVIEFLTGARSAGHTLAIVSHKTRHPFLGPQYDLHAAAREWVDLHLVLDGAALIPPENVFFELTKEAKLARIASFRCDLFLDDLPEILLAGSFPAGTRKALFDPESHHVDSTAPDTLFIRSWHEFAGLLAA
jgi:hypothetical protein